jgi:hypothetical protein
MFQSRQRRESVLQNLMRRFVGKPRNKSYAAGIKVETWIDEAVFQMRRHLPAGMASMLFYRGSMRRRGCGGSGEAHEPIYDLCG